MPKAPPTSPRDDDSDEDKPEESQKAKNGQSEKNGGDEDKSESFQKEEANGPEENGPDNSRPKNGGLDFPPTLWTEVFNAAKGNNEQFTRSMGKLVEHYHRVIGAFFRAKCGDPLKAEDLTGSFVLHLLEKNRLKNLERRESTRFRNYLSRALKYFWYDHLRGKDPATVPLDKLKEEIGFEPSAEPDLDGLLDREVANVIHRQAMTALLRLYTNKKKPEKLERFERLRRFILNEHGPNDYQAAADDLRINLNTLRQFVFRLRNDFYEAFRFEVSQIVRSREELDDELRYLLGLLSGEEAV